MIQGNINSRFNLAIALKEDKHDFQGAIQAWEEFLKLEPFMETNDGRIKMVRQEVQNIKAALSKK